MPVWGRRTSPTRWRTRRRDRLRAWPPKVAGGRRAVKERESMSDVAGPGAIGPMSAVASIAQIERFEVEACDTSGTADWESILYYAALNAGPAVPPGGALASSGTPGCVVTGSDISPPLVVNNAANSYMYQWLNGGATDTSVSIR